MGSSKFDPEDYKAPSTTDTPVAETPADTPAEAPKPEESPAAEAEKPVEGDGGTVI